MLHFYRSTNPSVYIHIMCVHSQMCTHGQVESLLTRYEWIATDRQYFGQPNTAYDFEASDPKETGRRVGKLQEQKVCPYLYDFDEMVISSVSSIYMYISW